MPVKRAPRLACALALAAVLIASAGWADDPRPTDSEKSGIHATGYIGLEYVTLSRQFEEFQFRGISREPYMLKVGDFQISGLSGFELGVNAAATSLLAVGGFRRDDASADVDTSAAERYAALIGYALGKRVTLQVRGQYARMTTAASPSFGTNVSWTTYAMPADGTVERLRPGDAVRGDTTWKKVLVVARLDPATLSLPKWVGQFAFGYEYVDLSILTPHRLDSGDAVGSNINLISQDRTTCHAVSLYVPAKVNLAPDLTASVEMDLFAGSARVASGFAGDGHGFCFGRGGTLTLDYRVSRWKLSMGYWLNEFSASVPDDTSLAHDLPYVDATGHVAVAARGSSWRADQRDIQVTNLGPFLRLSMDF